MFFFFNCCKCHSSVCIASHAEVSKQGVPGTSLVPHLPDIFTAPLDLQKLRDIDQFIDFQGSAPPWGAWTCNIPPSTVEMFLDYIAELQPDAILYTGIQPFICAPTTIMRFAQIQVKTSVNFLENYFHILQCKS